MVAGIGSLAPDINSVRLIGTVLVEAIVLYVGYGALEQLVGPTIKSRLTGNE